MSPVKAPPSGESLEKLRAAHERSEVAAAAARVERASRRTRTHSDVKDGGTDVEQGCDGGSGNGSGRGGGSDSGSGSDDDEPEDDDPSLRSNLFFMPPHLRVVQIQENPMILGPDESIFENLTFGIKKSPATDWDELEARAVKISKTTYYAYTRPLVEIVLSS